MKNTDQTLQFKTNINCSGCVAKVKPFLDGVAEHCEWEVDVQNKDKVLRVNAEGISPEQVMDTVQKAGFKIEVLNQ